MRAERHYVQWCDSHAAPEAAATYNYKSVNYGCEKSLIGKILPFDLGLGMRRICWHNNRNSKASGAPGIM